MSRSILKQGVCLAVMTLVADSAFAQASLPTINVGLPQTQQVKQKPRSVAQNSAPARAQNLNPGTAQAAQGASAPGFGPAADREQIFNNPPGQAVTEFNPKTIDYIQTSPQGGLDQTLKFSPGVIVSNTNTGGEPIISIRGSGSNPTSRAGNFRNFATRDIFVLSDGFPITTADGYSRTNVLDPHAFGGIEVFRGESSALFGNYALYGATNFKSYTGEQLDGATVGSEGGTFGYVNNYVRVGKKYKFASLGEFDISVFGSDVRSNGVLDHAETQAQTGNMLVKWSPTTDNHFTLKYMFNNTYANIPGALSISEYFLNPYQNKYGCPVSVTFDPNNIYCSSRSTPTNGVWGNPGAYGVNNLWTNRRQSFQQMGVHAHNMNHIVGGRFDHDFDQNTTLHLQTTYNYRENFNGVTPPAITGATGGPQNFYGPAVSMDARGDITSKGTLLGRPVTHFIGFIYNNTSITQNAYTYFPNAWYAGWRGGPAAKIENYTSNLNVRGREEVALTDKLTAVVGLSGNWNRVNGNYMMPTYQMQNSNTNAIINPSAPAPLRRAGIPWYTMNMQPWYNVAANNAYNNSAPEASLTYQHNQAWKFRSRYAVGYSTPAFESLVASPLNPRMPNTGLKAQTSMGVDAGFDFTPDETLQVNVTFFNEWFRNQLQSQVSSYDNSISFMQNIPLAIHQGLETGIDWKPIEGWRFFSAYTFYNFFFQNFQDQLASNAIYNRSGNYMPGQPAHTLTARVGYDIPHGDFQGAGAFVEYNFKSATTMDNANYTWIPGYGLINLNAHYEKEMNQGWLKKFMGYVEVRNLADTIYAASAMPFTNPVLSNGVQLTSPLLPLQGTVMPGQPRAVVAGMRVSF